MKKKRFNILLFTLFNLFLLFVFKDEIRFKYYLYKEGKILKNSISWSSDKKLKISDFRYEPEKIQMDNVSATVGIVSVHRLNDEIYHKSTTVFRPKFSFITKKDDSLVLRIAQARFDLCELYRRKMELKINSLNIRGFKNINSDSITKYEELYYSLFEKKWDEFNKVNLNHVSMKLIELEKSLSNELQ